MQTRIALRETRKIPLCLLCCVISCSIIFEKPLWDLLVQNHVDRNRNWVHVSNVLRCTMGLLSEEDYQQRIFFFFSAKLSFSFPLSSKYLRAKHFKLKWAFSPDQSLYSLNWRKLNKFSIHATSKHTFPPLILMSKKKKKSKKYFWIITTDLFKVFARTRQNWLVTLKNTWYGFLSGQPGSWNHKGISTKCCYSLMSRRRESMENISWSCTALGIFVFFIFLLKLPIFL